MRTRYTRLCATFGAAMICAAGAACGGGSSSSGDTPPVTFKVTVTKAGNGTGAVAGSGITCGTTCEASVASGTTVTLSATAAADGSKFAGWSGACANTSGPCVVKVTADAPVTATFFGPQLTLATAGHGGGSIATSGADGLKCGIGCTAFASGAKVTLTATPTLDSAFAGWTGCTSAEKTCEVTMDAVKKVTAAFTFTGAVEGKCYLPSEFAWDDQGKLADPADGYVSLKDFTSTVYSSGGVSKRLVYASNVIAGTTKVPPYSGTVMSFADWPNMKDAKQDTFGYGVAPTLFYFAPKSQWVLVYQWGGAGTFTYRTSTAPDDASKWSGEQALYTYQLPATEAKYGVIDQTVICDSAKCYLFFAGDNGKIYRSSMAIGDFPSAFPKAVTIMTAAEDELFEAVQVYTVQGTDQYLMIVECKGSKGRYFRAFRATSLGDEWTPLTGLESSPFAGRANVDFGAGLGKGNGWTNDISHGDLVRDNPDQTFTVDACKLQLLYQGLAPGSDWSKYDQLPWRPGLLTQQPRTPDP